MIPKVIHNVWLSNEPKSRHIQRCITSWKKVMPDYEIRTWTMSDFNFSKMPAYVQEALSMNKYAFVTDYLRLYILYNCGGCYLDSDVFMIKSFGDLFSSDGFYSFVEYHPEVGDGIVAIQAAALASSIGNIFVKELMDEYTSIHFIRENEVVDDLIAPNRYAICARKIGFKNIDEEQVLQNGVIIYPSKYLAGGYRQRSKDSYGIHLGASSWRKKTIITFLQNEIKYLLISRL